MKPKFSTGYLTPQTNRKKTIPKLKRSESINDFLNLSLGEVSEDVLKKLMKCPIKKQLMIDLITSEKDKIEAYKKKLEKQNDFSMSSPLQKVLTKPCESPTALLRRRLGQQRNASTNRDSDSESSNCSRPESRQSMASTVPSPVSFDKILEGVIAFVEVRSGVRDRSEGVKAILTSMGATVRDKFTKDVTHVIFKDGSFSTYQKANIVGSKLVSVLWLEACKSSGIRVAEKNYPAITAVGSNTYDHNQTVLCSQMQKDYEEIIREEFNRSIAIGEPLPSVKSVIDKRKTMHNVSSVSQVDSQDFEVANIMRRTIHGPNNNITPESPSDFDEQSDVRPIIDGDTDDIFEEIQQKTSTIPEDMDLTDVNGEGILENSNSKENTCPRMSTSLYNKKTPKLNKKGGIHPVNHSESPTLLDNIYKRRTKLFDANVSPVINQNCATPERNAELNYVSNTELTPRTLHIFSKNATIITPNKTKDPGPNRKNDEVVKSTYFNNSDKSKSVEKSTSTAMSSLQISNNTDKTNSNLITTNNHDSFKSNKISFSPLEPDIINNILEQLDDTPDKKNKVAVGKKQVKSNLRNKGMESNSIENPFKLLTQNVTVRKKITRNRELNEDSPTKTEIFARKAIRFSSSFDDDNGKKDENLNLKNPKLSINLRSRRKTVCCVGCTMPDKEIVTKTSAKLEQSKNRRKTIHTNKTVENRSQTIINNGNNEEVDNKHKAHRRKTITNLNTHEIEISKSQVDEGTTPKKKLRLSDAEEGIGIKTVSTANESSEGNSTQKSTGKNDRNLRNRRHTIVGSSKNKINSRNNRTRRSVSVVDQSPNSQSADNKMRKVRKLYDPDNMFIQDNSDEQEREAKRKAKQCINKPTIIVSSKAKERSENTKLNVEESSDESPVRSSKKQNKNKLIVKKRKDVNSDDDEQVELKNWISNRKKDDDADDSKRTLRNLRKNKNVATPSKVNVPRTPRNTIKTTAKQTPITPIRNRRSTLDFQSATLVSLRQKLKIDKVVTPSIVCTKLHAEDVQVFKQIVQKLGRFNVENEVSSKTTHLVAGEPKRTINMLRAVSMGCWILKKEWLFSSLESGRWLPEEDFEETRFSPVVQKSRLQRQAFGPSYTMDMFQDCGLIYIARSSTPRCSDLQELVILCKGKVTRVSRSAKIIVGEYVKYEGVICVSETWLLDCITLNKRVPFKKYLLKPV